jgi:hypothetical protein
VIDWEGFTNRELHILLGCQEYPEGDTAAEIRGVLSWRAGRDRDEC